MTREAAVNRSWALLLCAIVAEVVGTLSLRASHDHLAWLALVVAGYTTTFFLLSLVLRAGMPVGVAYGVWGALGTAATAAGGTVLFGDRFTTAIAIGVGLIIGGVLLVQLGSAQAVRTAASTGGGDRG